MPSWRDHGSEIPSAVRRFLETGAYPDVGEPGRWIVLTQAPGPLWHAYGAAILRDWLKAGRRPWGWWAVVALEPREHVGGSGEVVPHGPGHWEHVWRARCGIPLLRNASRTPVPRAESEAGYLQRLGLLRPGEAHRLRPAAFVPVTVAVEDLEETECADGPRQRGRGAR